LYTGCFGTGLGAMSQWTSKETLQHQSPVETFPFQKSRQDKDRQAYYQKFVSSAVR
jgi:hypothetical protein